MATTTTCRKKRKRKNPKYNHNHPPKSQPTTTKTTSHCKNKISAKHSSVADLTHCRKKKKIEAKPQPSSKNHQPSKQNCNPKIQPTHSPISPPCLQIKPTNHHHRDPLSKPIEKNWKGSSFIGSNPSHEIASSREPQGDRFQRAREEKKKEERNGRSEQRRRKE